MLLKPDQRHRLDESDDALFYDFPRFVTHVDQGFQRQLTELYRQRLQPQTRILDLMSSWVSHLPAEMQFAHVEGQGMNAAELAENPRLNHYFVQNLNRNPQLPFPDQAFDAVLNAVSVQYLQYPEAVFSEIQRLLKREGLPLSASPIGCFIKKQFRFGGKLGGRSPAPGTGIFQICSGFHSPGSDRPLSQVFAMV